MAKKIDRSVRISRLLYDARNLVQIEGWDHDSALLGELAAKVQSAIDAAEVWVTVKTAKAEEAK